MTYRGHVQNGVVVLDEPGQLEDGIVVEIAIVKIVSAKENPTPLRNAPYKYEDPFTPVLPENEWESTR